MYTYQIEYVFETPGVWSKIKISCQLRNHMKAEVIIFPLHYWAGVDSTSPPRTIGGKFDNLEDLEDIGQRSYFS